MTRISGKKIRRRRTRLLVMLIAAVGIAWWLFVPAPTAKTRKKPRTTVPKDPSLVLVTGYCNCGKCCGWKKSWFGLGAPVYDYGPNKGKPKKIGVTASGVVATAGTVAADPRVFRLGTKLDIPGYGTGRVEDVGGAIKGRHIDLWFPSHAEALRWGARWLKVKPVKGAEG